MTIWYTDANVTVGSVEAEAVGPYQQEEDRESGAALFHKLLISWDMSLPATFQHDPTGAIA